MDKRGVEGGRIGPLKEEGKYKEEIISVSHNPKRLL
jgi:hypothetical protein